METEEVERWSPLRAWLPATAMVIGVVVLRQIPLAIETAGVALVIIGVLTHRNDRTHR